MGQGRHPGEHDRPHRHDPGAQGLDRWRPYRLQRLPRQHSDGPHRRPGKGYRPRRRVPVRAGCWLRHRAHHAARWRPGLFRLMGTTAEYGLGEYTFPRGWFMVAEVEELANGPIAVRYFANDFVLYRGQSGRLVMLDAY